jgi:hypothetical protein
MMFGGLMSRCSTAATVRVGNRIADSDKARQQLAKLQVAVRERAGGLLVKARDGILERLALDEAHRIVGPAVRVMAEAIDRHDAGVLQPARDLRLAQEALPARGIVGGVADDLFQRDFALQFPVEGHGHRAEATAGVRPEDEITKAGERRRIDGRCRDDLGVAQMRRRRQTGQAGLHVAVAESDHLLAQRGGNVLRRETLLDIAAMLFQLAFQQPFNLRSVNRCEEA